MLLKINKLIKYYNIFSTSHFVCYQFCNINKILTHINVIIFWWKNIALFKIFADSKQKCLNVNKVNLVCWFECIDIEHTHAAAENKEKFAYPRISDEMAFEVDVGALLDVVGVQAVAEGERHFRRIQDT